MSIRRIVIITAPTTWFEAELDTERPLYQAISDLAALCSLDSRRCALYDERQRRLSSEQTLVQAACAEDDALYLITGEPWWEPPPQRRRKHVRPARLISGQIAIMLLALGLTVALILPLLSALPDPSSTVPVSAAFEPSPSATVPPATPTHKSLAPTPTPAPTPFVVPTSTPAPASPRRPHSVPLMPNLIGLGQNQALEELQRRGIGVRVIVDTQCRAKLGEIFGRFPAYAVVSTEPAPYARLGELIVLGVRGPDDCQN